MSTVDDSLELRLSSAIKSSPHLFRRKVRIEAQEGRIVLRGTVTTYYEKQMAQETLRRLDGVHQIENNLEVSWS